MATLSTYVIIDRWLCGLAEDGEPFYADGRRLEARGPVLSGPWRNGGGNDLAEWLPAGRRRRRPLLLVTGDQWPAPSFHSSVQADVRWACARRVAELGADMLLVPFSALESAGVIRSTIRALEIRPDRETVTYEPISLDLDRLETAPLHRPLDSYGAEGSVAEWRLADGRLIQRAIITGRYSGHGADRSLETLEPAKLEAPCCYSPRRARWSDAVERDDSGTWRIVHRRHWLGDSVFTADVETTGRRRRPWTVSDVVAAARNAIDAEREAIYSDTHSYGRRIPSADTAAKLGADFIPGAGARLAAVDIGAPIVETFRARRRRRFISSFDSGEPRPLYYLATLPAASRARTVETAEQDLAPAAVHAAMARGKDVRRQGDIFLVETDLSDTAVHAAADRRARLTQWTRGAAPRPGEVGAYRPLSARRWRRIRAETRATWRAATAEGLTAPGPTSARGARRKARTELERLTSELEHFRRLARADVLKGDGRSAERRRTFAQNTAATLERVQLGRNTRLQTRDSYRGSGAAAIGRKDSASAAAWRNHSGRPESSRDLLRETLAIYATAHSATEVAIIDGRPYVKGIVRHVPDLIGDRWRRAEHVPIKLPAGRWYLAIRNTVPRQGDTSGA